MKNIILLIFISFITSSFGQDFTGAKVNPRGLCGLAIGKGSSKSEAYIAAVSRVPGNAVSADISYSGFSSYDNTGKPFGNYTCYIKWKKITARMMK
jgi:hypothetical protein